VLLATVWSSMEAPGTLTVIISDRVANPLFAPGTSNGFVLGLAERGSTDEAIPLVSTTDFVEKCGDRIEGSPGTYDEIETAFREGASQIYFVRRVGPEAASSSGVLVDSGEAPKSVLEVFAASAGEWGNDLQVIVTTSGGERTFTVKLDGTVVEAVTVSSNQEFVDWVANESTYLADAEVLDEALPKAQTVSLEGGDDDLANIATSLATSLAAFAPDLGPGQILAPEVTDEAEQEAIGAYALATNRRYLGATEETDDEEALAEVGLAARAWEEDAPRATALFGQTATIPGLNGSAASRKVSWAAVQLGLIARSEGEGNSPNKPAAGERRGMARFATGLTVIFTDAQRKTLADAGVNTAVLVRGVPTNKGDRTVVNPVTDKEWRSFAGSRLAMAVAAAGEDVMRGYEYEQIDGHGYIFGDLEGELSARALMPFYLDNALYGREPKEAFAVNTGPDVNTPTSIENEEIKAQIAFRRSKTGERLILDLVRVPSGESI
jgi:hypothetical protein